MKLNTVALAVCSEPMGSLTLPDGVTELGHITDTINYDQHFSFLQNNKALTIIESREVITPNGKEWSYFPQKDVPLEFLTWFPETLEQFRDPNGPFTGLNSQINHHQKQNLLLEYLQGLDSIE